MVAKRPDLLIAGGGGAGLLAALRAGDLGLRTLVLERDGSLPSNTAISSALMPAAGTTQQRAHGIEDRPADLAADIRAVNDGRVDDAVLAAISTRAADVVALLEGSAGIAMHLHLSSLHTGHRRHRMHGPESESGATLIDGLRRAVGQRRSVTLRDGIALRDLLIADGRVVGVRAETPAGIEEFEASAVLLACGGFGAAPAMLSRHCPAMAAAAYTGSPTNRGDGIRAGRTAGAALAWMGAHQAHAHLNPGYGTHLTGALPGLGAILVNDEGRRFGAEDVGSSQFAAAVLAQPGGRAIEIVDAAMHRTALGFGPYRAALAAGAVKSAADPAELAALFALPAEALAAEIARTSADRRAGRDAWGRRDSPPPLIPPFHAAVVTGALAHTQGGLRIDAAARVLDDAARPIPNLFAAGGTAASISGTDALGYLSGNGLLQSFTTALLAVDAIAEATSRKT